MLRMTDDPVSISSDDDSDAEEQITTSKRKKRSGSSAKPVGVKKLRGHAARKAAEVEERQRRQVERQGKSDAAIVGIDETDCCLRCGIGIYRQAVEEGNVEKLKRAVEDYDNVATWDNEDCEHWSDMVVATAMLKGDKELVGLLLKAPEKMRVAVPDKYLNYGSNTGYVSRYTFGHAVSKVNESRGNRQGNSAFYRTSCKNILEVDISRLSEMLTSINVLAALQTAGLDPDMVDFVKTNGRTLSMFMEQKGFYYTVSSGNWDAAGAIIKQIQYRAGLNHLHTNVLTLSHGEPLETYRRNQILKKWFDAGNITPLECAAIHPSNAYLKELFEQLTPAERIETDEFGRTVAHFAAASSTPDCLEYLIEQDFQFSLGDKFKITPLIQAARFGRHKNIRPLLKHLSKGDVPCTEFADQTLIRQRWRPLHYAAYFGHAETCRELIDCGATVESIESSLHATPLLFAAKRGHLECVKVLIEHGKADPEVVDRYSRTPLHLASINGKYEVTKYLLEMGVNADAADSSLNRPIHYAAGFGHLRLLRLLIEVGGADPSAPNVWRTTACSVANLKGHISIVQYLLTECNIDVNFKDQDGKTLLHHCVEEKVTTKLEAEQVLRKARLLISKNANPNLQTVQGETVLHSLARSDYYNCHYPAGWVDEDARKDAEKLEYDDMDGIEFTRQLTKMILDAGANLDLVNNLKETPLGAAVKSGNDYVMAAFIERGAKYWDTVDDEGVTFFQNLMVITEGLDQLPTRREMDRVRKSRYQETVNGILEAVLKNPVPQGETTNINTPNKNGYTAIISSIAEAGKAQRQNVKAEKARIKKIYKEASRSYSQGSNDNESTARDEAVFEFRFQNFIAMATKIIEVFHPDMNAVVQLPKDFYANNPKRPKSEYPAETGYSALHFAATLQDESLLQFLLSHGCDPNQRVIIDGEQTGDPPMLTGYFKKTFSVGDYLPETDVQTIEHANKLFNIVKPDFEQLLPNAVKQYLSAGANPCIANKGGFSALMKAAKSLDSSIVEDMCATYIQRSFDGIDNLDNTKRNALMYAVDAIQAALPASPSKPVDVSVIKHLLNAGANPNSRYDGSWDTVMAKVIRLQYAPLINTVIEYTKYPIDHTAVNKSMESCAIIACKNTNLDVSKTYFDLLASSYTSSPFDVNVHDKEYNTALILASKSGNDHAVTVLLACQANPNQTIEGSKSVTALAQAIQNAHLSIAQLLLNAGANVNFQDDQGKSPLHHAVLVTKYHLVKLLLEFGADVHATDNKQRTALHLAIEQTKSMTNASLRIERLLLQAGANINAKDILGRTPLHLAFIHMDIIPHMREMTKIAKKVNKVRKDKSNARAIEKKVASAIEKFTRNNSDQVASEWIGYAVRTFQQKVYETKSSALDDIIVIDQDEMPQLELYSQFKWEMDAQVPGKMDPIDIIKFLSNYSELQPDPVDHFGRTPLHYAATVGAFSSTSILISKNVNINAQDLDKNTPLQLSLQYKHVDYSVMLCNQGATPSSIMTLPAGDSMSTLNYSLSKDFMNMAYLILDRHPNVLESLEDAFRTGKFHVADILINSVSADVLSGTTNEGRNLWHIVANFKPFDNEIWDEYLPDLITKLADLGLPFITDVHQRTPIHYAAKHGQTSLLNKILAAGGSAINKLDEDGLSELWYAASAYSIGCVQALLSAGAIIGQGTSSATKDSALLLAVKSKNVRLVKTLLEAGVPKDEDSVHDRPNAVMQACMDKLDKILKALLEGGVDPNVPSTATYELEKKKRTITIHPVFIASGSTFDTLIEGGANANVVSPTDKPWEGRTCFMYVSKTFPSSAPLMLMLKKNIDLDLKGLDSERSVFYHYFFDSKVKDQTSICADMMQNKEPNVNMIDSVTGMTPLELAIRDHNAIRVERLLELGADPNVASCRTSANDRKDKDLYQWGPLNAIFHAVAQNDFSILQIICRKTKHEINWRATDDQGRTIISFLVGSGYSHENVEILKFLANTLESDFNLIADIPDNKGLRPIDHANARERKAVYEALVELDITLGDVEMGEDSNEDMDMNADDHIAMQVIEEDAEAERAVLEAEAKAAADARGEKSEVETKEKATVDPASQMEKIGQIALDEEDKPYDIMLQKIDVTGGYYGCNMFYKLSVIYNTVLDLYVLWTRWGSFGETGMHQKTPYLTKEEAVAEFKSIFRAKTGNHWEDHDPSKFESKPAKFELIHAKPPKKPVILNDFTFLETSVPSQLSPVLYNTMQIFCDFEALSKGYSQLQLDIPAGQIPQKFIDEAYGILDKIEKEIPNFETIGIVLTKKQRAERKAAGHRLGQYSNQYFRMLPKASNQRGITPILRRDTLIEERARLNNVNYLNFPINLLLAAKRRASEVHPLDYCFRSLHCQLNEVDSTCPEFNMVQKYMLTTAQNSNVEITKLFTVNRKGEEERFASFANNSNRKLLWHGSQANNFLGILKQGLRAKPAAAAASGSMFGDGIYFADTFAKSLAYSTMGAYEAKHPGYALLMLCEVALGKECEMMYYTTAQYKEDAYMSVKGVGMQCPNPANVVYDKSGAQIPMGPIIDYEIPSGAPYYQRPRINYNEYIVYNENQVRIRYLVVVRDNQYCELCQSHKGSNVQDINNFKDFDYSGLCEYERDLVRFNLTHTGKTAKEVVNEHLDAFLAAESYSKFFYSALFFLQLSWLFILLCFIFRAKMEANDAYHSQ
ncbi:ankyrin repeat-containing domain protein [Fennellomyces sp. T-0311]|nr:ankyrin repeat-containing domain protein [Fennellomyces sp. T-0311]